MIADKPGIQSLRAGELVASWVAVGAATIQPLFMDIQNTGRSIEDHIDAWIRHVDEGYPDSLGERI
jgi:hypothetical protein